MHNINQPYLQAANIKIKINHLNVTISSAYFPPGQQITEPKLKSFIQSLGNFFIIGGDFNAKHTQWGSRYTNTRGRLFHTSILKNKLSFISPDEPTYWPAHENRSPDILDFFITSIPTGLKYHIKNLNELSSDHSPIQLTIGAFPASSPTTSLSSGPIDWKIFQQKLDISLSLNFPLKRSSDIDNAISILTNSIQNAISTSSSPNPNKNQPKYPTSLPTYLVDLIKAKRQARSLWQRTKYPIHKTIYNHLITDLKTQLAKFRSEQFSKHLSTLTPNNGSLWKMTKKLINHRDNTPPLERPDKSLAISDLEKANLFCDHLSSSFSPHSDLASSPDHVNLVNSFLSSPLPMSLPAKSISPAEIVSVIHKLRPNKSPGHDQITNKIAKNLPKKAILFLTHIYNAMLRLSYFPPTWKYSIIIMISKPNKPKHLTSSYRPISLLPTFAKLFEKLILHRISPLVDQHNILPKSQFGFRRKHNTIHQIHRITDKISASFETKQYCPGVFLDISKAFDRVWHDGLLFKLKHFLPSHYYLILKSYLENRSFSVRQKNNISSIKNIESGVPQGSNLSPLLYNIFTADIPTTNQTLLASFADDTAILTSNNNPDIASQNLQLHLNKIESWAKNWKIKINDEKSSQILDCLRKDIEMGKQIVMKNKISNSCFLTVSTQPRYSFNDLPEKFKNNVYISADPRYSITSPQEEISSIDLNMQNTTTATVTRLILKEQKSTSAENIDINSNLLIQSREILKKITDLTNLIDQKAYSAEWSKQLEVLNCVYEKMSGMANKGDGLNLLPSKRNSWALLDLQKTTKKKN
ncbi:hypothetical protein QTP88_002521 [Uroleucon formosanum]